MQAKWATKWPCPDSQEVGLEAAILERVRNSSLVERGCADNETGLKPATEATGRTMGTSCFSRGAWSERGSERGTGRGGQTSENAGMSSEDMRENRMRRSPQVSDGRSIRVG